MGLGEIYRTPIDQVDETELRASRGLVLTEWKVASKADLISKLKHARTQLDLYQAQTLAAVELRKVQLVVVVSEKRLAMPDDEIVDGVRRRFINVPVDPAVASKAATS